MPRYELVSKTSDKFWEIVLEGSAFETRYGRRGTAGRVSKKTFASAAQARAAYDRIIAEKVREGYRLASTAKPDAARGAPLAPGVIKQLRRLGATIDGADLQPVPLEQFSRVMLCVCSGSRAPSKRRPAEDVWNLGLPDTRDPFGQLTHVPAPVATFLRRVAWPPKLRHKCYDDMLDLSVGNSGEGLDVGINNKRRVLCPFGYDDEFQYFLDALDTSPDPMVYRTDDGGLGERETVPLSRFLAEVRLRPDA
jgi:predicted DNA-binding WGR domain protein